MHVDGFTTRIDCTYCVDLGFVLGEWMGRILMLDTLMEFLAVVTIMFAALTSVSIVVLLWTDWL